MEQKILFEATWMDWGVIDSMSNPLVSKNYKIYFDGTVYVSHEYAMSGWGTGKRIKLRKDDFENLQKLFDEQFLRSDADDQCYDGEGWKMCLYNEDGSIAHSICGYIYEVERLEEIAEMLENLPIGFVGSPGFGSGYPFEI